MPDVTFASNLTTSDWISYEYEEVNPEEAEFFQLPPHINRLLGDVNWLVESEDIDELMRESLDGMCGWVRQAVSDHTVKLKRMYERIGLKSFADYCRTVLNRAAWSINQQIEGAFVVIELAREGFKVLPQNAAQARLLKKYVPTGELADKWRLVIDKVKPHELTVSKIEEILEPKVYKPKAGLGLLPEVEQELAKEAAGDGVDPNTCLMEMIMMKRALKAQMSAENSAVAPEATEESTEISDVDAENSAEISAVSDAKPKLPYRWPAIVSEFYQPVVKGVKSAMADIGKGRSLSLALGSS